ncbi:serine/threonine-protein kinase [Paraclostridium sordellii]|uniref:serine/threonine-protein kinase n=1 Tax=Paraclostridium sordellii TaxID=1505 RepID=UPI0030D2C2A8
MKNKGNDLNENIETEYIEVEGIEETEYIDIKTDKISKYNVLNDRYKIIETIGKGGMGAVYKALDMRLKGIEVAIKEISLETIEDKRIEKVIKNFENEAATLISLRHNAIPRVMDFFSLNKNKCYIVMDLIDGETLDEVIKKRGKIPENEVREWINQLADVLKYLHSREPKIIFRDLKPSNVMLTKDNQIKLIDFGIARTFKDDKSTDTTYYVSKGFSPPEQYGTGQSDERSDIYSLGALAYSLLIGGKPKIKDFKFESLKSFIEISDELNEAIIKSTEFRPENRPQTVSDFLEIISKNNSNNKKNFKSKYKIISIGILGIALILMGIYVFSNKDNEKTQKNNSNILKNENHISNDSDKRSISKSSDKTNENSEIEKAADKLYKVTNTNRKDTLYEYNPNESYVQEENIKDDYYIFNQITSPNTDYSTAADMNFLVNKKTFDVYVYPAGGKLETYSEYAKSIGINNGINGYTNENSFNFESSRSSQSEENWKEECKRIHMIYGWDMCKDAESHRMLRRDLSSTGTSGEPGNTVDIETTGRDWYKECLDMHDGECESLQMHDDRCAKEGNA